MKEWLNKSYYIHIGTWLLIDRYLLNKWILLVVFGDLASSNGFMQMLDDSWISVGLCIWASVFTYQFPLQHAVFRYCLAGIYRLDKGSQKAFCWVWGLPWCQGWYHLPEPQSWLTKPTHNISVFCGAIAVVPRFSTEDASYLARHSQGYLSYLLLTTVTGSKP